jgi:16S rRNA (cytidine1402-2'-O)-methyltransferase
VVIDGPAPATVTSADIDAALRAALKTQSVRDAATCVAQELHQPKRVVYARALTLSEENK